MHNTVLCPRPTLYCTPILLSLSLYSFLWAFKLSFKRETFVRIQIITNKQRAVIRSQFQKWTNSIIWDRDRSEIQWRLRSVYSESVHRLFNDTMYMRYLKSKATRGGEKSAVEGEAHYDVLKTSRKPIPCFYATGKVHYCVLRKKPELIPILSDWNLVSTFWTYFSILYLMLSSSMSLGLLRSIISWRILTTVLFSLT